MSDLIEFGISKDFAAKVNRSEIYGNYNSRGVLTSYGIDLELPELCLAKKIKSSDSQMLLIKTDNTLRSWEDKYKRYKIKLHKDVRSEEVEELNKKLKKNLDELSNLLNHTLDIDDAVDWELLKCRDHFKIQPTLLLKDTSEEEFLVFDSYGKPLDCKRIVPPEQPTLKMVENEFGVFAKLFRKKTIRNSFESRMYDWKKKNDYCIKQQQKRQASLDDAVSVFEIKKKEYEKQRFQANKLVDDFRRRYESKEKEAIEEYCDLVLSNSEYPDSFNQNWVLEFRDDSRILVVDYDLPSPELFPTVANYRYVKTRDEIVEKQRSKQDLQRLYDSVVYQICIRTIHELFEADVINAIDAVGFNGLVTNINPATGIKETKNIISVVANRDQFLTFDLSKVDPKESFKHMKGVAAANLVDLTPIAPVIQMDRSDKRFVNNKNIVESVNNDVNLAAMHWEDFEHLVRELFEKEFASNGGEVKVTQASSDGGVDAIAFDPDPIRGGKIVIQAKRYTNVVGVSAVRDLFGTVMNEGATKGVLVTTSDYGNDSYEFAKGKPITLLNGNNLLALLEKHGHNAYINTKEAKLAMSK